MEHWKPVPGLDLFYAASSLGRVKSLPRIDTKGRRRKEKVLTAFLTSDGYVKVCFFKDGRSWHPTVHRVVFEAFHGPIPEGHEINHKNGTRADNTPENLESLSHADNVRYSKEFLKANYATFGNAKITEDEVRHIRKLIALGGLTQSKIGEMFGVHKNVIGNIKTGHSWSHVV